MEFEYLISRILLLFLVLTTLVSSQQNVAKIYSRNGALSFQCGADKNCSMLLSENTDLDFGTFSIKSLQQKIETNGKNVDEVKKNLHCEIEQPNCGNGICVNTPGGTNSYKCFCDDGYTGAKCDTATNVGCNGKICQNGASCELKNDVPTCVCTKDWYGTDCQFKRPESCDQMFSSNIGLIMSPGYPFSYPSDTTCTWTIEVEKTKIVQLTINSLRLGGDCNKNAELKITDSMLPSNSESFCSYDGQIIFTSTSNKLSVVMKTGDMPIGGGVFMMYSAEKNPKCGETFQESSGSFEYSSNNQGQCVWVITNPSEEMVSITFSDVMLNNGDDDESYISIEIHDETTTKLVDTITSDSKISTVNAQGKEITIKSLNKKKKELSFKVVFETKCGGHYDFSNTKEIMIHSPGYPGKYSSKRNCIWTVNANDANLLVEFTDFQLESHDSCDHDYLAVYDGIEKSQARLNKKLCGSTLPLPIYSTTTGMRLVFSADGSIAYKGFKAKITKQLPGCGGVYTGMRGVFSSPSLISQYPDDFTCKYIMSAESDDYVIIVRVTQLNITNDQDKDSCMSEYITFYDGISDKNRILSYQSGHQGRFCGTERPPLVVSSGSTALFVHTRHSNSTSKNSRFTVVFEARKKSKNECDRLVASDSGFLTSPGFGNEDSEDFECRYRIMSNFGHFIMLVFEQFAFPKSENCENGYLKVYNSWSESSDLVNTFCGNEMPPNITSRGNEILLVYKSTKGSFKSEFKLKYIAGTNVCGGTFYEHEEFGQILSPNYGVSQYKPNLDCRWVIHGKEDNFVTVLVWDLKLQQSTECSKNDVLQFYDGNRISDPLISEYCGRLGIQSHYTATTQENMLIRFKTDSSIQDDGFALYFLQVCGGSYEKRSGTIKSPKELRNCTYTIRTKSSDDVITLTFNEFNVGEIVTNSLGQKICFGDVVTVSGTENGTLVLCGSQWKNKEIKSAEGQQVVISYQRLGLKNTNKFELSYKIAGCTQDFEGPSGEIMTPGYPNKYKNKLYCTWNIKVAEGKRVQLQFSDIDLAPDCSDDFVTVYNGDDFKAPPLGNYCMKKPGFTIHSSSNNVAILFETSEYDANNGFKINYKEIDGGCGGILKSHHGLIHSPAYPKPFADEKLNCEYVIQEDENKLIEIKFDAFDLDDDDDCSVNYLAIMDKENPSGVKKYCGASLPPKYISTSNQVTVQFVSENNKGKNKGFSLEYNRACGGKIMVDAEDYLQSLHYPSYYDVSDCKWELIAKNSDERITLKFIALDVLCDDAGEDGIMVTDPNDETINVKICGQKVPAEIISKSTKLNVHFKVSTKAERLGFKAQYSILNDKCGYSMTWFEGEIASPGFPSPIQGSQLCEWHIKTFAGSKIRLNILNFELGNKETCDSYLEVYAGNSSLGDLLLHRCRNPSQGPIGGFFDFNTNEIIIRFNVIDDDISRYFRFSYRASCEEIIISDTKSGYLESPNYPNYYPNRQNCIFVFRPPIETLVSVRFETFDLQENEECIRDSLRIIEDPSRDDGTKTYCGANMPEPFTTISNYLVIFFQTDSSVRRPGFRLHYDFSIDECGQALEAKEDEKNATSIGYPNGYQMGKVCSWDITAKEGSLVELFVYDLDMQYYDFGFLYCFDFISIYDYIDNRKVQIAEICHPNDTFNKYQSSSNRMTIEFDTVAFGVPGRGFNIGYKEGCGGLLTSSTGVIKPPIDKLTGEYKPNQQCNWQIKVTPGDVVELKFTSFNLEESTDCENDYVTIYNGPDDSVKLGTFCNETDIDVVLTSSSYEVYVVFVSNAKINKKGFSLEYREKSAGCGYERKLSSTAVSDVISSPNFPNPYPNAALCEWVLEVDEHFVVELQFDVFSLTNSTSCATEYVEVRSEGKQDSNLIGRYCGNNLPENKIIKSMEHTMYVKFKSEKLSNGEFTGFNATWRQGCGGHYWDDEGMIKSPKDSEGKYPANLDCLYQIDLPLDRQVLLDFKTFDMGESSDDCSADTGDYIELLNADVNKTLIKRLCGNTNPSQFTSNYKKIYVHFVSNNDTTRGSGFEIKYHSIGEVCGGELLRQGSIQSPNYPGSYQFNRLCRWTIRSVPEELFIRLLFSKFELEDSANCTEDYVAIYDGADLNSRVLKGKHCGGKLPEPFTSSSTMISVDFYSNNNRIRNNGFLASFQSVTAESVCGDSLRKGVDSGIITSPNYPSNYPSNTFCAWHIVADEGKVVKLTIEDMHLEAFGCVYDYLHIYDGSSSQANSLIRLCDNRVNNGKTFYSSRNEMFLIFRTDNVIEESGFNATWEQIDISCGIENLPSSSGMIRSSGFPENYPGNKTCIWKIDGPTGLVMDVRILSLDIPESENCTDNQLVISNGHSADAPEFLRICGNKTDERITLDQPKLKIMFKVGVNSGHKGFELSYKARGKGCGGSLSNEGDIESPNYPNGLGENLDCEWTLTVPKGKRVVLKIVDLDIFGSNICVRDEILIYSGSDNKGKLVHRLCSNEYESIYQSDTNEMYIRLITRQQQATSPRRGFKFHFNSGCGGNVTGFSGTLETQNYPQAYPVNLTCAWNLVLPNDYSIVLDDLKFDLPPPVNGVCKDRVEIKSSYINTTYCGTQELTAGLVVPTNKMETLFVSDEVDDVRSNGDHYTGVKLHYSTKCGAILSREGSGSIKLPVDGRYDHAVDCVYILQAKTSKKIRLQVKSFDVEFGGELCYFDYLEIRDGGEADSPLVGKFCNGYVPPTFVSSSNQLYLRFVTDGSFYGGGFVIAYSEDTTLPCGGEFRDGKPGVIKSPNYPDNYPVGQTCGWSITVPKGKRVQLNFTELSIPRSPFSILCQTYIYLYDNIWPDSKYRLNPARICGTELPSEPYYSLHNNLYVWFIANNESPQNRKFKAEFQAVDQACGERFTVGTSQKNYNSKTDLKVADNETCEYIFEASEGKQVEIVLEVDMPPRVDDLCEGTFVYVLDGMLATPSEIHRICGKEKITFQSTHNVARVRYINKQSKYSFKVTYRQIEGCNKEIKNAKGGLITSPNHPYNYQKHSDCKYKISAKEKTKISLFVETFEIEYFPGCLYDFLSIYDGEDENAPKLGNAEKYCGYDVGDSIPVFMQTSSNNLFMHFKTDYAVTHDGFAITYVVSEEDKCGGDVIGYKGALTSPKFPSPYEDNLSCEWKISPGDGIERIMVTFKSLEIDHTGVDTPICDAGDYLEFEDSNGKKHKLCGGSVAKHYYDLPVTVRFISDAKKNEDNLKGFHFVYEKSTI